jgi:carboxyvinyl-carboxyphosphonate phosphorylmutase
MNWTPRRHQFRAILTGEKCLHPASVFDPPSARVAEDLGFEVSVLAGSVASMAVLGAPDHVTITLTELADHAYRICRAGKTPLLIDADNGFGNALNVMRTVAELETAGVSALTIEDTALPTPFARTETQDLISLDEGVGKMRAALAARQDPGLVIIARTGAIGLSDMNDAINRAKAYEKTGVDALFLVNIRHKKELKAIHDAVSLPLLMAHPGDELDIEFLQAHGVRICLQMHLPILAALKTAHDTMKALRDGQDQIQIAKNTTSPNLTKISTRDEDYHRWIESFLTP